MSSRIILSLKWNDELGEATIDFKGMDKLFGIEQADFLDDVIGMLVKHRVELDDAWAEDYVNTGEQADESEYDANTAQLIRQGR